MKRKDEVLSEVEKLSSEAGKDTVKNGGNIGFDAKEIADMIGSSRSNVTTDLNELFKEGSVLKIKGKPVRFFSKSIFEKVTGIKLPGGAVECTSLSILCRNTAKSADSFSSVIGSDGSLSEQIKQAKAAVLYPPMGLHTLLLGETGVGKSMFAELMYRYAVSREVIGKGAPFVVFNCADYYSTPQLLISQLFGSLKGAYTGAENDRMGIIEQANGGVLFLDEVHRLPPEGQEMLFSVIDRGVYQRLGETKVKRKAEVLIIAATTEDPGSVLLKTFIRRIPAIINIPPLRERPVKERFELVKQLFTNEAARIKIPIHMGSRSLIPFLYYDCPGNIGQLRTDIQLTAARGFLEHVSENREGIDITGDMLPPHVREATIKFPERLWRETGFIRDEGYTFNEGSDVNEEYTGFNQYDLTRKLYEDIAREAEAEGKPDRDRLLEIVRQKMEQLFYNYSSFLYRGFMLDRKKLVNYISEDILNITGQMLEIASKELDRAFGENIYLGLAFHLNNLIDRNEARPELSYMDIEGIDSTHPEEYRAATQMLKLFCSEYKILKMPDSEICFLTMLLASNTDSNAEDKKVGLIVAAHGKGVASSIAGVVNELLGGEYVHSIDMALDENPEDALRECSKMVRKIDRGSGVLMLVDMGSLAASEETIKKATGINVMVLKVINTPVIIDAGRKAMMPGSTIDDVSSSIIKHENFLLKSIADRGRKLQVKSGIIITVCLSGQGTAYALKDAIEKMLSICDIQNIKVAPVSIVSKSQGKAYIEKLAGENHIIAIAGNINPKIPGIPFIGIEEIILKKGLNRILNLVGIENNLYGRVSLDELNEEVTWDTALEATDSHLQFLSVNKIKEYIFNFIRNIENSFGFSLKIGTKVKLFVHISYMIERLKFGGGPLPPFLPDEDADDSSKNNLSKLYGLLSGMGVSFKVDIPFEEAEYLYEILKDDGDF